MTFDAFQTIASEEPELTAALERAAAAARPSGSRGVNFDPTMGMAGMAALVILFPIVNEIVRRVGLPWVKTVANYSELWRLQFEHWLDEQYKKAGFDRPAAEAASQALLEELQGTADKNAQQAWERLLKAAQQEPQA